MSGLKTHMKHCFKKYRKVIQLAFSVVFSCGVFAHGTVGVGTYTVANTACLWDEDTGKKMPYGNLDEGNIPVALNFSFPYCNDRNYTVIFVNTNGYITLGEPSGVYYSVPLDMDILAPFGADLQADGGGTQGIYVSSRPEECVITWDTETWGTNHRLVFQCVINNEGIVKFNWMKCEAQNYLMPSIEDKMGGILSCSLAEAGSAVYRFNCDTTPPSAVTDLEAEAVDSFLLNLKWTAPGDNAQAGSLMSGSRFLVQYSNNAGISWSCSGAQVVISTNSVRPGDGCSANLRLDTPGSNYYFRIWTSDDGGLTSAVSNEASAVMPPDTYPPGSVTDLSGTMPGPGAVLLSWTAPGNNGAGGNITGGSYEIKYSTEPADGWFSAAGIKISSDIIAGQPQKYKITLTGSSSFYFWMKTCDDLGNCSQLSNAAAVCVLPSLPPYKPLQLLCKSRIDPVGIFDSSPSLSWVFSDPNPWSAQSACRVLVADSQEILLNDCGNMWDAAVNSGISALKYNGLKLQNNATYYWKVKTWDESGGESPYSAPAKFVMANINGGVFSHPYAVNNWYWSSSTCQDLSDAHFSWWRVMVSWEKFERYGDDQYDWGRLDETPIYYASVIGTKLSLCVYNSPYWSRNPANKALSYSPQKYAEFITELLKRCEERYPGGVAAVEVENEYPTGLWESSIGITNGTDQRDPSWFYAEILKAAYSAVQSFNDSHGTDILVVMDGIWDGAYHHLDELYQLGCKGYFDRINFHYYLRENNSNDAGKPEDPADTGSIYNFMTNLQYLKYIAESWGDESKLIWLTEYGWRITDEAKQALYARYILDTCRKSGFVDLTALYLGSDDYDLMSAIVENTGRKKPLYDMFKDYGDIYPEWNAGLKETLSPLPAASADIFVQNSGFELGDASGWSGSVELSGNCRHSGTYSGKYNAPGFIETKFYPVEPGKLYEITAWVKIDAATSGDCSMNINNTLRCNGANPIVSSPRNYYGIVDTRKYAGGWRRIRYMILINQDKNEISVHFGSNGSGALYVDDLQIKALNFSHNTLSLCPELSVEPLRIDIGELPQKGLKTSVFNISNNVSTGVLTGILSSDAAWISVNPVSFTGNNVDITLTVNGDILRQPGSHSGKITIDSNGGQATVEVIAAATCVLARPNPLRFRDHGAPAVLTFYGDGIVPGQTKIIIYTLSGTVVAAISAGGGSASGMISAPDNVTAPMDGQLQNEITWAPSALSPGIYIYTYESPKEKGVGKFTVVP